MNATTITVTKAERGYVDASGTIYTEKEVIFNRKSFAIEGVQPKKAAKKSSHKSTSTTHTQSNKHWGSEVRGEMAYTSQFRQRCNATLDLVIRVSEVAL